MHTLDASVIILAVQFNNPLCFSRQATASCWMAYGTASCWMAYGTQTTNS